MKKWFVLILSILLTISISGCSPDPVLPTDDNSQSLETSKQVQENQQQEKKEQETEIDEKNYHEVDRSNDETKGEQTGKQSIQSPKNDEKENQSNQEKPVSKKNEDEIQPKKEQQQEQTESSTKPKETVTLSIVDLNGPVIPATKVEIEPNDTVLSVTVRVLKEKKIQYEYTGKGASAYVKGIDNLYEMDEGPLSGWLYKKNGTIVSRSAGIEPVTNGDRIEWFYTKDYTKVRE
ncbi:DUF4430 domain-containing protein [Fervidibacillus halotolerans]|uniref:DUF4430 domain-containing protein n=1 Tax=Fervidibacillus halotolerans TaxID=2980027 RepID=A0A9E8M099_9BACI|nr:DUF4430 domain-containing protein [Fervidibacillus halotolerans]WAA12251.1 DUF4430 domain-containing protein [Fervidibacillus halotolerans]